MMPHVVRTPSGAASPCGPKSGRGVRKNRHAACYLAELTMMATVLLLALVGLLVSSHQEPAAPKPVKVAH
jgi:hypothetical protein